MNKWDKWYPDEPPSTFDIFMVYTIVMAPISGFGLLIVLAAQ